MNQAALLPGINEMPEFVYFITEQAAHDGWRDSEPLEAAAIAARWEWLERNTPAPGSISSWNLVLRECTKDGDLRVECGNFEMPPWLVATDEPPILRRANSNSVASGLLGVGIGDASTADTRYKKNVGLD